MVLGASSYVRDDDRALRRLLLAAMALGFVALIGAGVAAWWSNDRNAQYGELVDHTYRVREAIGTLEAALERSETARRGFLLNGDAEFGATYRASTRLIVPLINRIARDTRDNPSQVENVGKLRRSFLALAYARERSVARVGAGQIVAALNEFNNDGSVQLMGAIRARLRAMEAEEARLLSVRSEEQRRGAATFLAILSAAGALVMLVAGVSLLTVTRYTRDLGASRARLATLNESLEDQVEVRTADLSRANEEIQRFAYIVSHDLRSPLVNVMGFTAELEAGTKAIAELVDRVEETAPDLVTDEAREAARTDLPEAIGFIRTSTAKMDRLINAILKLSREGRRVITPEPIDMEAAVAAIRDTLQHRLDETGGEIVIEAPLPRVVSDRLAIEQIFANVIENAVKYRHPARPVRIAVRGHGAGERAVFEIADNGRGIDPRDHARVFDLFRRSGAQDQPGEGIGLAHVRALTYRLGGTIDVASTLGEGATFRINLPLRFTEPPGQQT